LPYSELISTVKKQGHNIFSALRDAFDGAARSFRKKSLAPKKNRLRSYHFLMIPGMENSTGKIM